MTKRLVMVAALVVAGAAVYAFFPHGARCADGAARLDAAYGPGQRERVVSRYLPRAAKGQVERITRALEETQTALGGAWAQTCERNDAAGEPVRRCVEQRLAQFEVVAAALVTAELDPRAAAALAGRLDDVTPCLSTETLAVDPPPDDGVAKKAIHAARVLALTADGLRLTGRLDEALQSAEHALNQAHETTWAPVEAEAALSLAAALRAKGRADDAGPMLTRALELAEKSHHDEVITRVAAQQLAWLGARAAVADADARRWSALALSSLERLPRKRLQAELDVALSLIEVSLGRLAEGERVTAAALSWATAHDASMQADVIALQAQLLLQHGQFARAVDAAKEATRLRLELLGPQHPLSLQARVTFGEALARSGRADDAKDVLLAALDELRQRSDVSPLLAATALLALGVTLEAQGHVAEALPPTKEAKDLLASTLGPKHRATAVATRAIAERLRSMGRGGEALAVFTEAIELSTEVTSATHRETLESRAQRALTLAMAGQADARAEAAAVIAACDADPTIGDGVRLTAKLALAFLPDATPQERVETLALARAVRGPKHPDVVRALLLQHRAKDPSASSAGREALTLFNELQVKLPAYAPLSLPTLE